MSCKKCNEKEKYTCGKHQNARCIDYEGELHDNTLIEECDNPDVEDVIEDINAELNFLHSQTDLSNLGECGEVDYPATPETLTIPQALKTHEDILCELIAHTGYGEPDPCPDCDKPCNSAQGDCCSIIKHFIAAQAETFVGIGSYPNWAEIPTSGYQNLKYTTTQSGIYKITVDLGVGPEDPAGRAHIGISKDGVDPGISLFEQYEIIPNLNSHTFHFIVTVGTGVELKVVFKGNIAGTILVDSAKMIVEKVG